jgi:hypothetical protein
VRSTEFTSGNFFTTKERFTSDDGKAHFHHRDPGFACGHGDCGNSDYHCGGSDTKHIGLTSDNFCATKELYTRNNGKAHFNYWGSGFVIIPDQEYMEFAPRDLCAAKARLLGIIIPDTEFIGFASDDLCTTKPRFTSDNDRFKLTVKFADA